MSNIALTDWLTFAPAGEIRRQRAYIDLPAFSYAAVGSVGDPSVIVAQFNFSASRNFYLLTRPTKPAGVNYGLCIRYRVGETVYRYKLWEDPLFVLSTATPLYNKQLIKKNFVLEVWNFATVAPVQTTSVRMLSSVRSVPTDYRAIADYALAVGAEFTDFDNVQAYSLPTSNLVVDLNADALSVGAVAAWPNAGSGGGSYTGSGTCALDTKFNAHRYVNFDGVSNVFSGAVAGSGGVQYHDTWLVMSRWGNALVTKEYVYNDANGDRAGLMVASSAELSQYADAGFNDPVAAALDEEMVLGTLWRQSPTVCSLQKNDDTAKTGALVGLTGLFDTTWSLGQGFHGYTKPNIARFLIYNTAQSAADRELTRQYLMYTYQNAIPLPLTFNSGGPWLDNV